MQSKISSFFKSSSSSPINPDSATPTLCGGDCELALWENTQHQFVNTYKRRAPKSDDREKRAEADKSQASHVLAKPILKDQCSKTESMDSGKVLNKKRSYAQFHLDFGQSDFNLRTCSVCGVKYAPGEEKDEKEHKTFHKNYTHGVQFKGCRNGRVIHMAGIEGDRILLVLDSDSNALRNKVQEVIKMMEIELGSGWIFHKLCKRIAGCVVAEPIKEAFKVLPCLLDRKSDSIRMNNSKSNSTTIRFGEIMLRREVMKKVSTVNSFVVSNGNHNGAIVCEEEATPAICGIRAIWVTPSNRRKRIASQLLDAVRRSFCMGLNLEKSQLAFSPPTSSGKTLASRYTDTPSFLVYKHWTVKCSC